MITGNGRGMGVGGHELGRGVSGQPRVGVLQPLQDDLVATLDRDGERPARRARRRGVGAVEVGSAIHAVPTHGYDDQLGRGTLGRSTGGGDLERLLERVSDDPVHCADAYADAGDGTAGSAPLDRLDDALALTHLVHGAGTLTCRAS